MTPYLLLRRATALVLATAVVAVHPVAHAQAQTEPWPNRTVRIIVPFVAGGPTDAQARWAAQQLTTALGQPFIIENRAAAGGVPATLYVAKSSPDGYTLLAANPGPLTVGPHLKPTGYTLKDLAPILLLATTPSCIVVANRMAPRTFQELVALAKSKPGQINYGSPGIGTVGHLTQELMAMQAGMKLNHIPYRGAAQLNTDVVGGTLDLTTIQVGACAPLVREGKVRALAVTSATRAAHLPEVPTLAESGLAGFDTGNWNGLLAPAGTPPAIVQKIAEIISRQLKTPEARAWLDEQGYIPGNDNPEAFGRFMEAETERWGRIVKATNTKVEE